LICFKDFTSLNHLKIFLQNVNSKQRANYQLCTERCTITTIIKVIVASEKRIISLSVSTLIVDYVKLIIAFTLKSVRSFIICYTCKTSDHLFKNCFQNKINTLIFWVFTFQLHKIIISENKENEKIFIKKNETKN